MSVFSIIYILLAVALLLTVMKSRLDLVTICSVCFIVYSIYCIPGIGISGFYRPKLSCNLYFMIYIQIALIFIFSVLTDKREKRIRKNLAEFQQIPFNVASEKRIEITFYIYTAIIFCFAFSNIIAIGVNTFLSGKENVWEKTNILYIISLYGTYPSFAYGIHKKKVVIWLPALLIELTIFIAGSRAFTATMIILLLCEFGSILWKKRKSNLVIYLLGATAIVFLLIYRMIDTKIMHGDFSGALTTLSDPNVWKSALEFNEPRVIIANYDYVLTQKTQLPAEDILYRILDFIPGFSKIVPMRLQFPEYFSDWLQQEVQGSAGVGGTIWGESYAMFGYVGISLFTILWLMFIKACSRHLDYPRPSSYFIVSIGTYLAWYINRLDFNRVAQACKVILFCYIIWMVIYLAMGGSVRTLQKFAVRKN